MSIDIHPVSGAPQGPNKPDSLITRKYNLRRKISFIDIQKAIKNKCDRSKKKPEISDMLQAIQETVKLIQKNFIFPDLDSSQNLLRNLLHKIESLKITQPDATEKLEEVSLNIKQVFRNMKPQAALLGEGRVKAAYELFQSTTATQSPIKEHNYAYLLPKSGTGLLGKISGIFHTMELKKEFGEMLVIKSKVMSKKNPELYWKRWTP